MAPSFSITNTGTDVIILAGDIDVGSRGIERAISEALRVNGRACSFFAQRYQLVC